MDVQTLRYVFCGAEDPPPVATRDSGPFCQFTVGQGTSYVRAVNGFMVLALDATLETQLACLFQGDELPFDIDHLQQVDFFCKLNDASLHPSISVAFGLASARNNDPDLIAQAALFRCYGGNAVTIDTDDGLHDNNDVATGMVLGTTLKRFTIDFASGLRTVSPGPSLGGKAAVLFSIDDDRQNLRPVARLTTFDMSTYAGNLQLFAQIQKGDSSSVVDLNASAALLIQEIAVRFKTHV